jgi:ABC-type dipeptide/oligopeptide/nickel transport system ATPase component
MMMADQPIESQEPNAQGRLDFHLKGPNGDDYIIKIKLYQEPKKTSKPGSKKASKPGSKSASNELVPLAPREDDEIIQSRKLMEPLAQKALKQIKTKYAGEFEGGSNQVFMIALVIAKRTFVLAKTPDD